MIFAEKLNIYSKLMKNKSDRIKFIRQICIDNYVSSQEELLEILRKNGYNLTQATLSRDLKRLKISKNLTTTGEYRYVVPINSFSASVPADPKLIGVNSLEFSGPFAVIKTKSGYAAAIASEIDRDSTNAILGTIAGDDTILVIPREGFSRDELTMIITKLIEKS